MLKSFLKSIWFYLILIVILTIPLCLGFFGDHLINGHDSMGALIRALSMDQYMGHGQYLVRWSPDVNWGYGYPMFSFYPPFFSFISVLFFQLTHQMPLAINCAAVLFWVLSGVGMFLLAREFWGDEGGVLSALLYVYAPYHIVDLYVRGAFAEFSSFAFFPFLLLAILKISRKLSLKYVLLGIASVFGLSLTHNIMSMLFFPVAIAYMFYLFFTENKSKWIIAACCVFIIGLMMSSFFWLPAILEKKFLNLNFLISMRYDFHKNFISLSELFCPFNKSSMDGVTLQVGMIHTLLCLITLGFLFKILKMNKQIWLGYIFFLVVGAIAIFFTLPYSHLLWEKIGILSYIQFPWRILTIIVFAMSFLGGAIALLIKGQGLRRILLITAGVLVILVFLAFSPKPSFIVHEQGIESFVALGEGEYTPKWVMIPPNRRPNTKFEIIHGKAQLAEEKNLDPVHYQIKARVFEPALLCFHTFYFPGWLVYVDGRSIQPYINNPFGLILFYLPSGDHDIRVVFGPTPIRTAGVVISWIGVLLLVGWIACIRLRKNV